MISSKILEGLILRLKYLFSRYSSLKSNDTINPPKKQVQTELNKTKPKAPRQGGIANVYGWQLIVGQPRPIPRAENS